MGFLGVRFAVEGGKMTQRCCVSLIKFSYWSEFHVNFMTGSEVKPISVYKGLTRNP